MKKIIIHCATQHQTFTGQLLNTRLSKNFEYLVERDIKVPGKLTQTIYVKGIYSGTVGERVIFSYLDPVRGMLNIYGRGKIFELVEEIPNDFANYHSKWFDEEQFAQLMNPHPLIITQLSNLVKGCGEVWKDDSREEHVDDVDPIKVAYAIYEALESHKLDFINKQLIPYAEKES